MDPDITGNRIPNRTSLRLGNQNGGDDLPENKKSRKNNQAKYKTK